MTDLFDRGHPGCPESASQSRLLQDQSVSTARSCACNFGIRYMIHHILERNDSMVCPGLRRAALRSLNRPHTPKPSAHWCLEACSNWPKASLFSSDSSHKQPSNPPSRLARLRVLCRFRHPFQVRGETIRHFSADDLWGIDLT